MMNSRNPYGLRTHTANKIPSEPVEEEYPVWSEPIITKRMLVVSPGVHAELKQIAKLKHTSMKRLVEGMLTLDILREWREAK